VAIKNIIAKGIGFSPGTIKWIPTHGFGIGVAEEEAVPGGWPVAGIAYVPGAMAGHLYVPGAYAGDYYVPGAVAGELG
jgi:hypothetical protein